VAVTTATAAEVERELAPLPAVPLPRAPQGSAVWSRFLIVVAVLFVLVALGQIANLLMQLWLMQSLGFASVFWKNFTVGAILFGAAVFRYTLLFVVAARVHGLEKSQRRRALQIGFLVSLVFAYIEARHYPDYLLFIYGKHWGIADPIFHHDIGFYVFKLPAIQHTVYDWWRASALGLIVALATAWISPNRPAPDKRAGRTAQAVARLATPYTLAVFVSLGLSMAAEDWLRRWGLLYKANPGKGIPTGASNVDITGFFSGQHAITVESFVVAGVTLALAWRLRALRRAVLDPGHSGPARRLRLRWALVVLVPALVLDFGFKAMVGLRNIVLTTPNEPLVQLPYISDHIKATNYAYDLNNITIAQFKPKKLGDPLPDVNALLNDPALQNVTLWPGFTSWLHVIPDPAHAAIPFIQNPPIDGKVDTTISGPTLATFQQQQKLRPYYNFLDVRTERFWLHTGNGPPVERIYNVSPRELPLIEPKPWLAWWGQRFVVFTHGWGYLASQAQLINPQGEPVYDVANIPVTSAHKELSVLNPAIYYGEGSGSMGFSNLNGIQEHNYPTDNGRAQVTYPPNIKAGVSVDSPLKRIVFGYKAGSFLDIFFTHLIKQGSRVHYFRQPLDRLNHIAPFLYYDNQPYLVPGSDHLYWLLNGMATTGRYPYSRYTVLGDTTDERTFPLVTGAQTSMLTRRVNYVRDSVKATLDAYTGAVHLYIWKHDPIIDTYAAMYPHLFQPKSAMPTLLAQQVQYPQSLMHAQFADAFAYSHMTNPLTFYSNEDQYEQAKQVLGSMQVTGPGAEFSMEPYYWLPKPGANGLPPSSNPNARSEFAMSMIFTPANNNHNLRAIATAYMDGNDYGRLSFLEVPKGYYVEGPEQADSAIDQDPFVSMQAHLWQRQGLEIIRGQMLPLIADGELFYIEPWFMRSKQNPLPRLKRIMFVFRGQVVMEATVPTGVYYSVHPFHVFPTRGGPELGGEPVFIKCTKSFCPHL
jgi:uncharacterized membrane protein (UPF0182 family)